MQEVCHDHSSRVGILVGPYVLLGPQVHQGGGWVLPGVTGRRELVSCEARTGLFANPCDLSSGEAAERTLQHLHLFPEETRPRMNTCTTVRL